MNRSDESSLILLRHGQSTANAERLFTGVIDAPLTEVGREEAKRAGDMLQKFDLLPRRIVSSTMFRARQTVDLLLEASGGPETIVMFDWRLSERNYGALTGRTKSSVLEEFGPDLFRQWRRSARTAPPPMSAGRAAELGVDVARFGLTESLDDVIERVRPTWEQVLRAALRPDDPLLVVAHGNSLRALCAIIDDLDEREIAELNVPTGQPLVYQFAEGPQPLERGGRYLDPETALTASAKIADEGGT